MWHVAEAKNKFSEFLSKADSEGPQRVTGRGRTYVLLAEEAYRDLFKKQVAVIEETVAKAERRMKGFDTAKLEAESVKAQAELACTAFEKALSNMQVLAEAAQKGNTEAYEIVAARIQESMAELRDMAQNLSKRCEGEKEVVATGRAAVEKPATQKKPKMTLGEYLLQGPSFEGVDLRRDRSPPREVSFDFGDE